MKRARMAIVRFVLLRLLCRVVMENQLPFDTQVKNALYFVISALSVWPRVWLPCRSLAVASGV